MRQSIRYVGVLFLSLLMLMAMDVLVAGNPGVTIPFANLPAIDGRVNPAVALSKLFVLPEAHLRVQLDEDGTFALHNPLDILSGTASSSGKNVTFRDVDLNSTGWWKIRRTDGTEQTRFEIISYNGSIEDLGDSQVVGMSLSQFESLCGPFRCPPAYFLDETWFDVGQTGVCGRTSAPNHSFVYAVPPPGVLRVRINFTMNYTINLDLLDTVLTEVQTTGSASTSAGNAAIPVWSLRVHPADTTGDTISGYVFMKLGPNTYETASGIGLLFTTPTSPHACAVTTDKTIVLVDHR